MIITTIRAALNHRVKGYSVDGKLAGYTLYIVRDKDFVLYVGQSLDPLYRLFRHMGQARYPILTNIGYLIEANKPKSLKWTYELRKPEECIEYVEELYRIVFPADIQALMYATFLSYPDVDVAEQALIRHFRPPMNDSGNPEAKALPECYQRARVNGMKEE